ncbi:MAG: hypothetical protein ACI8QC_001634 [Planctomycetota bacterium]|jgi:uncharacterized protein YjbI with pentapeptide repeats
MADIVQDPPVEPHLMANQEEVAPCSVLDRLVEEGVIEAGARSLAGCRLEEEDFSGLDLSHWDLTGASLERCDFTNARLNQTLMKGASLGDSIFDGAQMQGAILEGADLSGASLVRARMSQADLRAIEAYDASFDGATMLAVRLDSANLEAASLVGAQVVGARLIGTNLRGADLTDADLQLSHVKGACFDGCRVDGALMHSVHNYDKASWLGLDLRQVDFTGAYMLRSFILDQNYLEEFRTTSPSHAAVYRLWKVSSDCGRSLVRWGIVTLGLVLSFAWMLSLCDVDYGPHQTILSPLYMSVVTLTTLGYGDALPVSVAAQMVVMAEVITGYMLLGGLLSILSNKMARRAE